MKNLLIIGAQQFAGEVKAFVERYNLFSVLAFSVNERYIENDIFKGLPVYPLERIEENISLDTYVFIGISWGQKLNQVRKDIFLELKKKGYSFANLIAPQAVVLSNSIGEGNWFHEFSYIGHDVSICNNNEFMPFSSIGHYSQIGSHNHFAKCTVGGATTIGDCNFFGMQSIIYNRISIGDKNFIGAGTLVKKDVDSFNLIAASESRRVELKERQIEMVVNSKGHNFLK